MLRRLLLLAYSLAPGLSKVTGNEVWFGMGLLAATGYFLNAFELPRRRTPGMAITLATLVAFLAYALVLGFVLWVTGDIHERGLVIGSMVFLLPLLLGVMCSATTRERLLQDLPAIATVHALIALAIYPPTRPPLGWVDAIADPILEGTFAFRMASVSGSLAFATMMTVALGVVASEWISTPADRRVRWVLHAQLVLFTVCAFLTLQRAAWVAIVLIFLAAWIGARGRRLGLLALVAVTTAPFVAALFMISDAGDLLDLLITRLDTLLGSSEEGAVAERAGQWLNAWLNVQRMPLGFGPGQVGQPVRDVDTPLEGLPVVDGDYFRIVSEYGVMGVALVLLIGCTALVAVHLSLRLGHAQADRRRDALLAVAFVAVCIQGLGTNVTELFFVSSLFWALMLRTWQSGNDHATRIPKLGFRAFKLKRA
jgi:hypothetical protein